MAVRKAQGLKKGQHPELLGEIKVVSMRREGLTEIDADDCRREGFPELSPEEFVEMFCKHMGCEPQTEVTRIEFRKVKAAR